MNEEHPFRALIRIVEGQETAEVVASAHSPQQTILAKLVDGPMTPEELDVDVRTLVSMAQDGLVGYSGPSYRSRKMTFWSLRPAGKAALASQGDLDERLDEDGMMSRKDVPEPSEKSTDGTDSPFTKKAKRKLATSSRSFKALFSKK